MKVDGFFRNQEEVVGEADEAAGWREALRRIYGIKESIKEGGARGRRRSGPWLIYRVIMLLGLGHPPDLFSSSHFSACGLWRREICQFNHTFPRLQRPPGRPPPRARPRHLGPELKFWMIVYTEEIEKENAEII